tara:strand:+ start:379 stop:732 length:354 start_codon:yes stop_codon:yes gene_type:complete
MRTLAIRKAYPEVVDIFNDGLVWKAWDEHKKEIKLDEELIEVELEKLQAAYDSLEFQRLRKLEYPKIEDQLDLLYHKGIEGWKEEIQKVKDKYPKPVVEEPKEEPKVEKPIEEVPSE